MAEISALRKHPCPECGGDAEWNAGTKALTCPYCEFIVPWSDGEDPMGATIVEHDLETALASIFLKTAVCGRRKRRSNAKVAKRSVGSMRPRSPAL